MKTLTYILLLTFCYTVNGQVIGDKLNRFLDQEEELNISYYTIKDNYFEVIASNDSIITVFIFDYKRKKLIGIDYVCRSETIKINKLKSIIIGYNPYGEGIWKNNNLILVEKEYVIQIRDAKIRNRRIQRTNKEE